MMGELAPAHLVSCETLGTPQLSQPSPLYVATGRPAAGAAALTGLNPSKPPAVRATVPATANPAPRDGLRARNAARKRANDCIVNPPPARSAGPPPRCGPAGYQPDQPAGETVVALQPV